jgi:hypothetical protein
MKSLIGKKVYSLIVDCTHVGCYLDKNKGLKAKEKEYAKFVKKHPGLTDEMYDDHVWLDNGVKLKG